VTLFDLIAFVVVDL